MVSIDDCNNGTRARVLKLKFGHDVVRILNVRLPAWRDCVANRAFVFTRSAKRREASLAAGLLLSPTFVRGHLPDRHFSLPAHVLFAKPVTTFAGHACGAYFALV
jgi:hypothetical protein